MSGSVVLRVLDLGCKHEEEQESVLRGTRSRIIECKLTK